MLSCYQGNERLESPLGLDAPMFRLGAGVFETMLFNGRNLAHLDLHLARLTRGAASLNLEVPRLSWEQEIFRLLEQDGLLTARARVNIHLGAIDLDWNPGILLLTAPYEPPPLAGIALDSGADPGVSRGAHKTMSHVHYLQATRAARQGGCYDRLLLGERGEILETGSAALLLRNREGQLVCPRGGGRMDSTSLQVVRRSLEVREQDIFPAGLDGFSSAYLLNALVGALPIRLLGHHQIEPCISFAQELRELIWDL